MAVWTADLYRRQRQGSMNDRPTKPPENLTDESQENASPEVPEWLGSQLRDLYSDVMNEPMPQQFRDLLKQLQEKGDK